MLVQMMQTASSVASQEHANSLQLMQTVDDDHYDKKQHEQLKLCLHYVDLVRKQCHLKYSARCHLKCLQAMNIQ